MNADEIVKALRRMAENSRSKHDVLVASADLIESLQAQLAASQRREREAVEDLKISAYCRTCAKKCGLCEALSKRGREGGCKDYEWRGPQESGKGSKNENLQF